MAIRSIKDKITSMASGEILGETEDEKKEKANKPRKPSNKKKRNNAPKKKRKSSKPKSSREPDRNKPRKQDVRDKENSGDNKKSNIVSRPLKDAVEGYEDVLSILGIRESLEMDVDFQSNDLDYVEFSQTTPLGFDFDEVTDFISRTKYTLNKYETALERRERDIIMIASEVKKVEQRMIEKNQERELERMIGGMTEEERLIEENMNLKIEINELKNKLISSSEGKPQVNQELEALRAENQMLREGVMSNAGSPDSSKNAKSELPNLSDKSSSMPPLDMPDLEDTDSVTNMIKDMGGLYDEQ